MRYVTIGLEDRVFEEAERKAKGSGYESVDSFIVEIVLTSINGDQGDYGHLFTPERLAIIEAARAQVASGEFATIDEAAASVAETKRQWLQNRAR